MSSWVSRKQDHTKDGIPRLTKIIRKPKGVGTEVKSLADGVVGIMLQMEICERKDAQKKSGRTCLQEQLRHSDSVNYDMAHKELL